MAASLTGAVLILSIMFQLSVAQQRVDRTLQNGASGSDVVRAVTNKVQGVFGDDQQFLRRIAFVESKDGTDSSTYRSGYNGGIWQVDDIAFRATQDTSSHPGLILQHEKIKAEFEIDWQSVQWSDLRAPLYSGLAARLFLLTIPEAIPCDIAEQAAYWKKYYNTASGAGTKQKFIDDINSLTTSSDEGKKATNNLHQFLWKANYNNYSCFISACMCMAYNNVYISNAQPFNALCPCMVFRTVVILRVAVYIGSDSQVCYGFVVCSH